MTRTRTRTKSSDSPTLDWTKNSAVQYTANQEDVGPIVLFRRKPGRWEILTNCDLEKSVGKFLTWRPTLAEAKARGAWAHLIDLGYDDYNYPQ